MTAPRQVVVRVPATTANLGPGFDCLGLALDLWNETTFTIAGSDIHLQIDGFGRGRVAEDRRNLVAQAFIRFYERAGKPLPAGVQIRCKNAIPLGSGLGSSGSAVLAGLMGANALLGAPAGPDEILALATEMEGHPDNAAAAVYGGLTAAFTTPEGIVVRRMEPALWKTAVIVPQIHLPTQTARAALPAQVPFKDAVFNIGRSVLVVQALQSGDETILARSMQDRIHQPYRLKLIPGAEAALSAALAAGAVAAAISGAGPGLIAFTHQAPDPILEAMTSAMSEAEVKTLAFGLDISLQGASAV